MEINANLLLLMNVKKKKVGIDKDLVLVTAKIKMMNDDDLHHAMLMRQIANDEDLHHVTYVIIKRVMTE